MRLECSNKELVDELERIRCAAYHYSDPGHEYVASGEDMRVVCEALIRVLNDLDQNHGCK